MSRDVLETNEPCDGCGASSKDDVLVFDYMGDHFCMECSNPKEEFPLSHDRIRELVTHEREDEQGWDNGFHDNAAQIIEQLLLELTEAAMGAPQITDASTPMSDKERETVLNESHYVLGPYAKHHQNWIKRMEATVLNREEIIAQLKDECPDCDRGVALNPGRVPVRCMKCDGSGRRIVSQMLQAHTEAIATLHTEANGLFQRHLRIEQGLKEVGLKLIEDENNKIVVMLCPPKVWKL